MIASKPTVLGLDLRGGTQLIYQGEDDAADPDIGPDGHRPRDRDHPRARRQARRLRAGDLAPRREGDPGRPAERPERPAGDRADRDHLAALLLRLRGATWSHPRIERAEDPASHRTPTRGLQLPQPLRGGPVRLEAEAGVLPGPVHDERADLLPVRRELHQLLAGPAEKKKDLFLQFRNEKQPPGTADHRRASGDGRRPGGVRGPDPLPEPSEISATPHYVLKDRPALSGDDIKNPKQNFDPTTNQPNVTFDFTDTGRTAFQDVTRKIAQRGAATAPPGTVGGASADQYSQHFSVVLDNQVVTQPIINFAENPDGIDGRTGRPDLGQLHDQLGAGPGRVPAHRRPADQPPAGEPEHRFRDPGPAGARPGPPRRSHRPDPGPPLPDRLLPHARSGRGRRPARLRGLLLRPGQADPDHADPAGHRRADPHYRGGGRRRTSSSSSGSRRRRAAGRSTLSAIAQGYRKGIATIVDANVITLITAFILFVLATAGVEGFAFHPGVGTLVSLLTAVLFTQAILGSLGRTQDPALGASARAPGAAGPLGLRLLGHRPGSSRFRDDPGDRAISLPRSSSTWGSTSSRGRRSPSASSRRHNGIKLKTEIFDLNIVNVF